MIASKAKWKKAARAAAPDGQQKQCVHSYVPLSAARPAGPFQKDDPYGRSIHNYSHKIDGISLNDCFLDNSTEYISFKDRVRLLDPIK